MLIFDFDEIKDNILTYEIDTKLIFEVINFNNYFKLFELIFKFLI